MITIKPTNNTLLKSSKVKSYKKLQFPKNEKYSEPNMDLFTKYKSIIDLEKSLLEKEKQIPDSLVKEKSKIKNKLIEKNQPLVSYMINKYYNKTEYKKYHSDLFQEGILGLMNAVDGYDLSLGYKFSTYSTWWIRQSINTYIADFIPVINVPPHIRAARNKLLKNVGKHEKKEDFSAKLFEESDKLGYTKKMTKSIISAMDSKKVVSISAYESNENSDNNSGHYDPSEPFVKSSSEERTDSKALINAVSSALKKMSNKNKNILLLRFNVLNEDDITPRTDNLL